MKYSNRTLVRTENVQRYFKDINIRKYEPRSDVEVRKLFIDRAENRDKIINSHIRLVATIAKTYDNNDKFMDFNQVGIEGLIEAIEKYNPLENAKFSSYAALWIKAKMSQLCKDFNMIQRSNQSKIGSKAIKFQERFFKENMREATTEEILEHLSEMCDLHIKYSNEVFNVVVNSINEEFDNDSLDFTPESNGEFAVKTACENDFVTAMEKEHLSDTLNKMMRVLSDKEIDIITKYIVNGVSYADLAEDFKCTNERIRQIVKSGLKKLQTSDIAKKEFACYLK